MDSAKAIVWTVCLATIVVCLWSLRRSKKPELFGSETIRRRLRFTHMVVIVGAFAAAGMVAQTWFELLKKHPAVRPEDSDFLSLATVLVLFMLFGFVAFEAGTVSSAYRNRSAEKNLLVIMFSLAAYLSFGRLIYDGIAGAGNVGPTAIVFQAGFACTVALIISNALTERASTPTNVLCAIFSAGLGYPVLAALVWGDHGLLRLIGFVDASGASAVHLLGASASLTAAAAVGPRVRLQRWRFLGWPDTPDFSSPWSVVGGLFLMFGWLGFNSGNAPTEQHGHAFFNTIVGACGGALAAWLLSRVLDPLKKRLRRVRSAQSEQTAPRENVGGLRERPRIVIGMMGGLVAVTANGALPEVNGLMAALESAVGGSVAVLVSAWMSERWRAGKIDDPLGVIGTHGCAAIVGILFTALWLAVDDARFERQAHLPLHLAAQLIGCGVCIVVGWLVAMVPCSLLLTIERLALVKKTGFLRWMAVKFRLRLGAVEQLGTPLETPPNLVWKYRIDEAAQRIVEDDAGDHWWKAVETYATAAEVVDKASQANIAQRILKELPKTAGWPHREKVALVALGSSTEYKAGDIRRALTECLTLAERNRNGNGSGNAGIAATNGEQPGRMETLVWTIGLLTERAAVLKQAGIPHVLPSVNRGLNYLRKVADEDENPLVQDLARTAYLDADARLYLASGNGHYGTNGDLLEEVTIGPFDADGRWRTMYDLFTNRAALSMLLFLADDGSKTIADATEEFKSTRDDTLAAVELLLSHDLISREAETVTITTRGLDLVKRFRQSEARA